MAKSRIVARGRERELLESTLESRRPELLTLYGRRRVGKTYLIRSVVQPAAGTYLEITGEKGGTTRLQLRRFRQAIEAAWDLAVPLPDFKSWDDALSYLCDLVQARAKQQPNKTIALFFDELPWLATPRARLLESIDHAWNTRLSRLPQLKLILCGSAASWMLRRIVHAKGGLHNRLTRQLRLEAFTLSEALEYLRARRLRFSEREALELYMSLGGVPYYLDLIERGQSATEAIGRLCFERGGALRNEFRNVFESLFEHHEEHQRIVRTLARRRRGLTRNELLSALGASSGGGINRRLQELEEAGFVARVEPYDKKVKQALFRLIDEYTLFHLKWVESSPRGVLARGGAAYWQGRAQTPAYTAWAGYAFEGVCLKHAQELARALGISSLVTALGSWTCLAPKGKPEREGAQVDLLFERADGVINLCEIKFSRDPFVITKDYARTLKDKLRIFEQQTKTRKRVLLTLVAPHGLRKNSWSEDLVDRVLDARALLG
ncbi:MAG: ATP-binding protein [Proteobacteria bacterium]|nr:ATP-binding protein [Pseudomonadota bacterium]